ncbi:uncharacterized protein [Clytia hemisphaerica]|uniref:TLDc domain-containing protein n=1 Tax=Clytia hemisphaerica TaxID=252671 RepID=A0A7M5V0C0_9CNID|eukprot:TCONS_00067701-protein
MGNSQSSSAKTKILSPYQEKIIEIYQSICDVGILSKAKFQDHFKGPSDTVTKNLFDRFFIDLLNSDSTTSNLFVERVQFILDSVQSTEDEHYSFCMDILSDGNQPINKEELERIINECREFGMMNLEDDENETKVEEQVSNDDSLSKAILETCEKIPGDDLREKFIKWCKLNFNKMFLGFQTWIVYKFTNVITITRSGTEILPVPFECKSEKSKVQLNGTLLWFLCSLIPSCFTRMENKYKLSEDSELDDQAEENAKYTWNLLYDSNQHGLSLNRFKHKVMSYKSPTVSIITFSGGVQVVLTLDQPWNDSPTKFGGPYCMLIEISPHVKIIEANASMVYLKELGRAVPTGLLIGSDSRAKISIDKDLSTAQINYKHLIDESVDRMEVWGCGGVVAIKSQAEQKKWESREIEKRKKVKLPGQWDQDKTILEMGGVTVNHSQRGDM